MKAEMMNAESIVAEYHRAREVVKRTAELLAFYRALLDMYNTMYNMNPESSEDLQPRVLEAKAQHVRMQESHARLTEDLQKIRNVTAELLGFDPEDVMQAQQGVVH